MNSHASNKVRGITWAWAALTLILFCWLGLLVFKAGPILQDLGPLLSAATKLAITYGSLGLPFFGVVAAGLMIL